MIQVLEDDQEGDLTLYEMSPAQPILPVIVEAVAIDETNTYKIQITHIQTNTVTEAEIITSDLNLDHEMQSVETVIQTEPLVQIPVNETTSSKKRKSKAVPKQRSKGKAKVTKIVDTDLNGSESDQPASNPSNLLACLVCGRNFVSTSRLESHEKTHTKSRPFKCIDCGKTFTVRYSLICHTRVHTRERPYSCNLCGSRFSQASSLKTHQIYKHTKDFPYICKFCGRGFISPGQKHEHVSRSHSKASCATSAKKGKKHEPGSESTGDEAERESGPSFDQTPEMLSACVQTNVSLPASSIF